MGRSASTISRECHHADVDRSGYKAQAAKQRSQGCRKNPLVTRKLDVAALWETVQALLRARWSPKQIAGILTRGIPAAASYRVSHETIYSAVYLVLRGDLRKELIGCLRQDRSRRKPRAARSRTCRACMRLSLGGLDAWMPRAAALSACPRKPAACT